MITKEQTERNLTSEELLEALIDSHLITGNRSISIPIECETVLNKVAKKYSQNGWMVTLKMFYENKEGKKEYPSNWGSGYKTFKMTEKSLYQITMMIE
jgi:hypothetical protein